VETVARMRGTWAILVIVALFAAVIATALAVPRLPGEVLILATTTSTNDSGLLDYLLPAYESQRGVEVQVLSVGTGQALEIARRGDADVLLVHAPALEEEFVREGHGLYRRQVMFNEFIIVGPSTDPAGVGSAANASSAFLALFVNEAPFVSRGDGSGTHAKELGLWARVGLDPTAFGPWYQEAGGGMAHTLRVASGRGAYTLTDDATFANLEPSLSLVPLLSGDPDLRNQYSVIPVSATAHPSVKEGLARDFATWLVCPAGQGLIGSYEMGGRRLFVPNADLDPATCPTEDVSATVDAAGDQGEILEVTLRSLFVSGTSTLLAAVFAVPLGALIGFKTFRGRGLVRTLTYTLYGFPPVLAGLLIYVLLSSEGPLGPLGWLYTTNGMILAQTVLILPLMTGVTISAVAGVDRGVWETARTLGADEWDVAKTVVSDARLGVLTAVMVGFGRAISEVGAVMIVGGNIRGHTRVLTTSIVLDVDLGNFQGALLLGAILLTVSAVIFYLLHRAQERGVLG
jgi:tungstate transport system substrate-binding protein